MPSTGPTASPASRQRQHPPEDGARVSRLTQHEALRAYELAKACAADYGRVDHPDFLVDVAVAAHDLPKSVRAAVRAARLDERKHALIFTGNLIAEADLGPTPLSWDLADTDASRIYGFLLMIYGALIGDAIGWATQQDGRIITDVVPTPGQERSLVSASSHAELGWHTEDAFSPARADYVGLLCLRNPYAVPTTVAHLVPGELSEQSLEVLREPRFAVYPDTSHTIAGLDLQSPLAPLVFGHPDAPVLRVDRDFVHAPAGDDEAAAALAELTAHLDSHVYDLTLDQGDMCFLDNRNVAHGRRPFRPRYDGRDRWLKRINLVEDLRRTRPWRSDTATRVIG